MFIRVYGVIRAHNSNKDQNDINMYNSKMGKIAKILYIVWTMKNSIWLFNFLPVSLRLIYSNDSCDWQPYLLYLLLCTFYKSKGLLLVLVRIETWTCPTLEPRGIFYVLFMDTREVALRATMSLHASRNFCITRRQEKLQLRRGRELPSEEVRGPREMPQIPWKTAEFSLVPGNIWRDIPKSIYSP